MKVIFIKDVKNQGKKDEIKDIKDGYAKYLISTSQAVLYTSKSISILNNQKETRNKEEENEIQKCKNIKSALEKEHLRFIVKVGQKDKIFGSISTKLISEELKKKGFNIDKKTIILDNELNSLGTYEISIKLHKVVIAKIKVTIEK